MSCHTWLTYYNVPSSMHTIVAHSNHFGGFDVFVCICLHDDLGGINERLQAFIIHPSCAKARPISVASNFSCTFSNEVSKVLMGTWAKRLVIQIKSPRVVSHLIWHTEGVKTLSTHFIATTTRGDESLSYFDPRQWCDAPPFLLQSWLPLYGCFQK